MSEFTQHQSERVEFLKTLYFAITEKNKAFDTIKSNEDKINLVTPSDIVLFVDYLVGEMAERSLQMADIKSGLNKLLNVTYKAISNSPYIRPSKDSYFGLCIRNNSEMVKIIESMRPILIKLNKDAENIELRKDFVEKCKILSKFFNYYIIKENILFPLMEKNIENYKCLSVMWSMHDDIRKHLSNLQELLESEQDINIKEMNRLAGDLFFNIYAVKFREERILFPYLEENIDASKIESLWNESVRMEFPFYNPEEKANEESSSTSMDNLQNLRTGSLSIEQIILIFNHLPIDITYVDEFGKVRFFSNPPHRIFPRTTAIIGRDLKNCHPHESVHIVQKIVESFRNGSRDHADFWINMRSKRILIQYFAVRDDNGNYKGVLEASQEISQIQALEGEKRILDWE